MNYIDTESPSEKDTHSGISSEVQIGAMGLRMAGLWRDNPSPSSLLSTS